MGFLAKVWNKIKDGVTGKSNDAAFITSLIAAITGGLGGLAASSPWGIWGANFASNFAFSIPQSLRNWHKGCSAAERILLPHSAKRGWRLILIHYAIPFLPTIGSGIAACYLSNFLSGLDTIVNANIAVQTLVAVAANTPFVIGITITQTIIDSELVALVQWAVKNNPQFHDVREFRSNVVEEMIEIINASRLSEADFKDNESQFKISSQIKNVAGQLIRNLYLARRLNAFDTEVSILENNLLRLNGEIDKLRKERLEQNSRFEKNNDKIQLKQEEARLNPYRQQQLMQDVEDLRKQQIELREEIDNINSRINEITLLRNDIENPADPLRGTLGAAESEFQNALRESLGVTHPRVADELAFDVDYGVLLNRGGPRKDFLERIEDDIKSEIKRANEAINLLVNGPLVNTPIRRHLYTDGIPVHGGVLSLDQIFDLQPTDVNRMAEPNVNRDIAMNYFQRASDVGENIAMQGRVIEGLQTALMTMQRSASNHNMALIEEAKQPAILLQHHQGAPLLQQIPQAKKQRHRKKA